MSSYDKLLKLANKFEYKLAQQQEQYGTTELFFNNEANQRNFASQIQNPNSSVYKVLLNHYEKNNGAECSFSLKVKAEPNVGANWILNVNPPTLKQSITKELNAIYQKLIGESMASKQNKANSKAKEGYGSGELEVGALELTP